MQGCQQRLRHSAGKGTRQLIRVHLCVHPLPPPLRLPAQSLDVPIVEKEDADGKKLVMGVTELGKLRVGVEKARNLPDADWGFMGMGKSDPYVRLAVGMQVGAHTPRALTSD